MLSEELARSQQDHAGGRASGCEKPTARNTNIEFRVHTKFLLRVVRYLALAAPFEECQHIRVKPARFRSNINAKELIRFDKKMDVRSMRAHHDIL